MSTRVRFNIYCVPGVPDAPDGVVQLRVDTSVKEEAYGLVLTSRGKREVIPWHAIWRFEEITDD